MRTIVMFSLIAGAALLAQARNSDAQDSLQKKLQDRYAVTRLTDDRSQVVTAGAVLTLKKDGLVLVASGSPDIEGNTYKDGKIDTKAAGKLNRTVKTIRSVWSIVPVVPQAPDAIPTNVDTRKFVAGEKLNVTRITVKPDNSVAFELYSLQAYNDVYYTATLTFAAGKAGSAADKILRDVDEVFSCAPPDSSNTDTPASPVAAPKTVVPTENFAAIEPPPPPPDALAAAPAPVPQIKAGMTVSEVQAGFGQPINMVDLGSKVIYNYPNLKVTFLDGRVADVE